MRTATRGGWRLWLGAVLIAAVPALATERNPKPQGTEAPPANTIAVFRIHGELTEAPPSLDFSFDFEPKRSMHGMLERFRRAKKDDALKAVVLTFEEPRLGLAQIQELRAAIGELRAADKDVYCYLESASAGSYALATAASKIIIAPVGELNLVGMDAQMVFFKGLMDKIKVEADIEHIGAYKGAGEPFTRTAPSPEAKEMMEWLVKDIYDQLIEMIAKGRQMSPDEVRALIDRGPFLAKAAKEAKLVDEIAYAEDFTAQLRKRYGENVAMKHNYGGKKGPELDFSNIFSLFKSFGEIMAKASETDKPRIAVVYVDGMIVSGKGDDSPFASNQAASTRLRRDLGKVRDDGNVKAVVLRVDSPGGSALASDIIWNATQGLKGKKPFVVSMGNVAASGGYYVSAGASTIFAEPATITGSIGVVGGKLVTGGLWNWLGITFDHTKMGKNADLYSTQQKFTDEQREIVRKYMKEVYDEFTDRVKKGRGDKLKKELDQLAGGRVYTGRQAQANGLVDKLGGLDDAIKFAAGEANVSDYQVKEYPEAKNVLDLLVEGLSGEKKDDDHRYLDTAAGGLPRGWTTQVPGIREMLPMLERMDPEQFKLVVRSLMRIEMLGRERVLMVMPGEILIK